jgi:hypothetical protein
MISANFFTQERFNRSIQLDLGGLGGYSGVFFEQNLFSKQKIDLNFRTGFSTYKIFDFERKFNPIFILPNTFLIIIGEKHKIEYGLGTSFSSFPVSLNSKKMRENSFSFHQITSFRLERKSIIYKFSFILFHEEIKKIRPWFGLSFAYRLKKQV